MNKIAIVAVDDEKIILDSIRDQIEKKFGEKYLIEFAESAEEGLEICSYLVETGISLLLVITDYQMAGIKGDEFASILRQKYQNINIVMITGYMKKNKFDELIESKTVKQIIEKPWQEKELIDIINDVSSHFLKNKL
jgi:CheY-like chemotaxis protein